MKIILEREGCIGCGSCANICPKYFEMDEDGKANLLNSKLNTKNNNHELDVNNAECAEDASSSCPVEVIHIIK